MRWRLELMHKKKTDLDKLLSTLRGHRDAPSASRSAALVRNLAGFNVPNKDKGKKFLKDTLSWLESNEDYHVIKGLATENEWEIVVHYSCKFQNPERWKPRDCVDDFVELGTQLEAAGGGGALIVTGSKPRKNDSLGLLRQLSSEDRDTPTPALHCAFNPFIEDEDARLREYGRLEEKLATGLCQGVWLQIGTDEDLLVKGLEHIRKLTDRGGRHVRVYGGVFLPSKQLLAQQRFRPWAGVRLGDEYLGSVEGAREITYRILKIFREHSVVPLVESKIYKESQLQELAAFLGEGGAEDGAEGGDDGRPAKTRRMLG
mmetsp:Transcript_8110/g.24291  ORF Transcript_8110/g.24291 Transcript_8110/m.24291 type:complete len:316 (-) Transcript_8110:246-1193(-)